MWRSVGDQGQQWSGQLDHVQRRQSWRFSSLEDLLDHLRSSVGSGTAGISITIAAPGVALDAGTVVPLDETENNQGFEKGQP